VYAVELAARLDAALTGVDERRLSCGPTCSAARSATWERGTRERTW
jgi:hypothetical protein